MCDVFKGAVLERLAWLSFPYEVTVRLACFRHAVHADIDTLKRKVTFTLNYAMIAESGMDVRELAHYEALSLLFEKLHRLAKAKYNTHEDFDKEFLAILDVLVHAKIPKTRTKTASV